VIGAILLCGILVFGLLLLFGQADARNLYKFLIFLIVGPVLLSIGFSHTASFVDGLPFWLKILVVILAPFIVLAVVRIAFPGKKWPEQMLSVTFQALIYLISFPFRLLWRTGAYLFQQERRSNRLNRYRPVVGGGPPLMREVERERYRNRG